MAGRTQKRKFVWARSSGVYVPGEASGPAADLLADFKARAGGNVLLGSTVTTVRGIIRPNVAGGVFSRGVFGMRVCNEDDVESTGPGDAQTPASNPEADWMAFLPWVVALGGDVPSGNPVASWNEMASPWCLEIKAQRKMEELGETLGLFISSGVEGSGGVVTVDWHLSVGLKLP